MSAIIKVSVIIPVYNAEKYLAECLDSVIGQTLREIEIICVDDGSTDSSLRILREYAEKDGRLKIIEQANGGGGAARNAGMEAARGEYLAFLDADDLYYPHALETACACAEKFHTDMVVFEADCFDGRQGALWTDRVETECLAGLHTFSAQAIPEFAFQIASCNTWDKLYKRQSVQRTGLRYQEIKTANDLCFVYSAIACADQIAVKKESLVKHRILYRGNLQSVKVKTPLDFLDALEQLKQNLRRFGLWERLKQSYINCALLHCAHNWRTLDRQGKRQVASRSREIEALLELSGYSEQYYYNLHDYRLICKAVGFSGKGDLRAMGKIKDLLKHVLPPPVDAFNREVAGIKQYMRELNSGLLKQIELLEEQQKHNQNCVYYIGGGIKPELIISLTSYPPRIQTVHKTVETILGQTLKADRVILWLAESEFPHREHDLPVSLTRLCDQGLEIKWTKDLKSYKKLIPALREFPEAIIVTADDDVYYDPEWLFFLYMAYLQRPGCVHCHRCTYFYLENEQFKHISGGVKTYSKPTYLHKLVGIGGVLYPPHSLHGDVLDEEKFYQLARTNDDIWFWFMAVKNNYRINVVENHMPKPKYVEGTQDGVCLYKINDKCEKLFERDLYTMLGAYPEVKEKLLADLAYFS